MEKNHFKNTIRRVHFKIENRKMKKVHFIGIGGSGASAAASIAEAQGFEVTGCNPNPHDEYTKHFSKDQITIGLSPDHLYVKKTVISSANERSQDAKEPADSSTPLRSAQNDKDVVDIIALSPAILSTDPDNEEIRKARELGIEVLTWQEFMGKYLEEDKFVIAICGTHGKSTTTAMIAHMLTEAGLDPTVEIGAKVKDWGGMNYRIGKSNYFITEADEFNNNFLVSHPDITVLTNIDMDHPEFFKDFQDYTDAFEKFLLQNKGIIVANLADKNVAEMMKWIRKHTNSECLDYSRHELQLDLKVPGEHNKSNALAAFQVGLLLGIEPHIIIQALNSFTGIGRRQELLGEINGARIYTDYAIHPVEIEKTVEAIQSVNQERKVYVVFQPHMFSRTRVLFDEFVEVFKNLQVEEIFIVDIYASREKDPGDFNSKMIVEAVGKENIQFIPSVEEVIKNINPKLSEKDVVVFFGAGDIDHIARSWVQTS